MRAGGSDDGQHVIEPSEQSLPDPRRREALALTGTLTLAVGLASVLPNLAFWATVSVYSLLAGGTAFDDDDISWWFAVLAIAGPVLIFGLALGLLSAFVALAARSLAERRRALPPWGAILVVASAASLTVALASALPLALAANEELRQASALFSMTANLATWYYPLPLLAAALAAAITIARSRLRPMDAAPAAPESLPATEAPAPKRTALRVTKLTGASVVVGAIAALSPLWMAMVNGTIFAPAPILDAQRFPALFAQVGLAVAVPLAAIVLAIVALQRAIGGAARSVTPGTQPMTPKQAAPQPQPQQPQLLARRRSFEGSAAVAAIVLVASVCVGAATAGVASMRIIEVQQVIASRVQLAEWAAANPAPAEPVPSDPGAPTQPAPAPTHEPEVPSTAMTPDEARLAMEQLIATTVEAIAQSPTAPGGELRWLDASVASQSTGNDGYPELPAPSAAVEQSCLDGAGVQYSMPSATFALGLITDTSSDDNDSDVIDANVAAAERVVAAWETLGYVEDATLGGNIVMGGAPDAAAASLEIRFDFGIASVKATGLCVLDTR